MKANMDENVRLRRKCLELITSIATKGAASLDPDMSRCAMRLLTYGISRYNYNNPDMGAARARKELSDLEKMHWWLNLIDSEGRGKEAQPLGSETSTLGALRGSSDPAAGRDLAR